MATFGQLKTSVLQRLQDPSGQSVSSTIVATVLNDSLAYFKRNRYWFNESVDTITLTVDDPVIPSLPSDFLYELPVGGLVIDYSEMRYPLRKITSAQYDDMNVEGQGLPFVYTYRAQQFEVYYYPDQAYSLALRYIKDYSALANDGDTNDFTVYADRMLLYDALARICTEFMRDPTQTAYYIQQRDNEERNLLRQSDSRTGSGALTINSYLV